MEALFSRNELCWWQVAMKTFDKTRPLVAALATGVLARCLDEATK